MSDKKQFHALIQSNIAKYGYHVSIVNSPIEPRYAYSIGLNKKLGFELIFAGGIYYMKDELLVIFDSIVNELRKGKDKARGKIEVENLGTFSLSTVDPSWSKLMMLGVFDFFKLEEFQTLQIMPDQEHYTLDTPKMSSEFNASLEPVWQWMVREWDYGVPRDSTAVTNLDALKGEVITEVMRWGENEWEIFSGAGPEVAKEDMRVSSLGTLLGIDKSLIPAINLEIGKGMWRDASNRVWYAWG